MTQAQPLYVIIDIKTQQQVGGHLPMKAAWRKRDRLDLAYGAVRYVTRPREALA